MNNKKYCEYLFPLSFDSTAEVFRAHEMFLQKRYQSLKSAQPMFYNLCILQLCHHIIYTRYNCSKAAPYTDNKRDSCSNGNSSRDLNFHSDNRKNGFNLQHNRRKTSICQVNVYWFSSRKKRTLHKALNICHTFDVAEEPMFHFKDNNISKRPHHLNLRTVIFKS